MSGTAPVLVTGGTGTLGRAVVRAFSEDGRPVRVLSRRARRAGDAQATGGDSGNDLQWATGNLVTGEGLAAALDGVGLIVNCATTLGRRDLRATRRLVEAARRVGAPPLIHVSIVGVDRVPLGYYRTKVETERIVQGSGLPWTVQRATQFHDLVAQFTTMQRRVPLTFVPAGVRFQPIDVRDVALRLAELAAREPSGHVDDIGGPEVLSAADIAQRTLRREGGGRVVPVRVPGRIFSAYRAGGNLAPQHRYGRRTYDAYLDERYGRPGSA